MEVEEIKEKIQAGDIKLAAEAVGISPNNATQALKRPASKHFQAIVDVLTKVIGVREELKSELMSTKA